MKYLYLLLFFGLMSVSYGQQVIGSFPSMDGGLEGETVGTAGVPTVTSIASGGTAEATWTKSSGTATIQTSIARTVTKSINWVMTSATASRMVTPTTTSGAITNTTGYMVQFYYHSAAAPAGTWSIGISPDGTNNVGSYVTTSTLVSTGTSWTKYTVAVTSGKSAGVSNLLGLSIIRVASGASPGLDIDDFCMYPGTTADVTAPTAPTTPVFSTVTPSAQTLSWTAGTDAGSGVAGYLVVRSATGDPTAALNVNGIYTTGTVLTGDQKIIYQGTAATCTDIGLSSSTPYYYRIYTVDKAFNYSAAVAVNGMTSVGTSIAQTKITGVTFDGKIIHNDANLDLNVFDTTGRMIISSNKNINMSSSSRGVYIVKSNSGILKIAL